jgi:hypothetical protein
MVVAVGAEEDVWVCTDINLERKYITVEAFATVEIANAQVHVPTRSPSCEDWSSGFSSSPLGLSPSIYSALRG